MPNSRIYNIIKISGILVLISTSIFACKQRKQRKQEQINKQEEITIVKKDTAVIVIPKTDSSLSIIPINLFYIKSCGVCHDPYPKEKYNATSWGHILDSMQKRAHISDIDKSDLYTYLTGDTLELKK